LAIALGTIALSTACSDDNGNDVVASNDGGGGGSDQDGGSNQDGGSQSDAGQVQSDGQIAAVVSTANTGEVAQAQIALTKAQDPQVRDFAQQMVNEHGAANQRLTQLLAAAGITPEPNQVSTSLKADSDRIVQRLNAASAGQAFDSTYIDSQVQVHQKVLDLLEQELIPAAQNGTLRDELQATSDTVSHHLDEAQGISDDLESGNGADGGASDAGQEDAGASDGGGDAGS